MLTFQDLHPFEQLGFEESICLEDMTEKGAIDFSAYTLTTRTLLVDYIIFHGSYPWLSLSARPVIPWTCSKG